MKSKYMEIIIMPRLEKLIYKVGNKSNVEKVMWYILKDFFRYLLALGEKVHCIAELQKPLTVGQSTDVQILIPI